MDHLSSEEPLSSDLVRQINALRDEFRLAWVAGHSPKMEDRLNKVSPAARPHLLRALLTVEIAHRRDSQGGPISEQQLIDAHPKLAPDLKLAYQDLRALATKHVGAEATTDPRATAAFDPLATAAVNPRTTAALDSPKTVALDRKPSSFETQYQTQDQGLHIRCPHCSNPVELLDSTRYEQISCGSCGSAFSLVDRGAPTDAPTTLTTISRFEVLDCLGSGAFGTVWKARDPELDRIVALKVPRAARLTPTQIDFFFREARAAAQLRHTNIVPVYEVGRDGDTLFIVSDFVRGITLLDWLKGRRPSPLEIADLCAVITDGLHHAHEHGIVHRDLKPANILIDQSDKPHIMDFGLAKREIGEVTMTVDGQILGTPAYMSPEQAGGEGHWTDRRSDIYSLGIIAFEMLTGELPFRGNYQMQIQQRLTEDPPDARKLNRHISGDLATICMKCMDRTPGRRYATAADVGAEFRRFMNGEPILARPISAPARLVRWAKRKPLVATIAAMTIFLAIAGPTAALFIERQKSRLAELVVEKNNLIDQIGIDKQRDTSTITELSKQLALWEGRANPWEFWPPKPEELPRHLLLNDLYNYSKSTLLNRWDNGKYDEQDRAKGALGLAIMADDIKQAPAAIENYQLAREKLVALLKQNPDQPPLARALAECDAALARLTGDKDRAAAKEHFEDARAIHEQLASDHAKTAPYQLEWLESELNCATLAGYDAGKEHLQRATKIGETLRSNWPSEPQAVYRLACFMTQREPTLAPPGEEATP